MEYYEAEQIDWTKELPEKPANITFPGRYKHIDRSLAQVMEGILISGGKIKILDFACGPLLHGSPTAVDLATEIRSRGGKPEIMAVDINYPEGFSPKDPNITYSKEITAKENGFDVVRIFHLMEHAPREYYELREDIVKRIREGGLLVVTQYIEHIYGRDFVGDKSRPAGQIVKVLQKYHGEMRMVGIYPDGGLGWRHAGIFSREEDYAKFKEKVSQGMTRLDDSPRTREFNVIVNNLIDAADGLADELTGWLTNSEILSLGKFDKDEKQVTLSEDGIKYLDTLKLKEQEARQYFTNPHKKNLIGRWR